MRDQETIVALSSGQKNAAIQVIRFSGDHVMHIINILCPSQMLKPRYAYHKSIYNPHGEMIDDAIIIYFPAPHSFTGEDILELHCHGSVAIFKKICRDFSYLCRLALPGEFSYRAFLHGKVTLHEAESINDLVHAETEMQRKYALHQAQGGFNQNFEQWRHKTLHILAHIEACLDFSDEELPDDVWQKSFQEIRHLKKELQEVSSNKMAERLKNGIHIAFIGCPNAGKSTLLNTLSKRDIAIVHDEAGTTRDTIEVAIEIGGYAVILHDCAGIRESEDYVEKKGIEKAHQKAQMADFCIFLYDGSNKEHDKEYLHRHIKKTKNDIAIVTKHDLHACEEHEDYLIVSASSGHNIDALQEIIIKKCESLTPSLHQLSFSYERQRETLKKAASYLADALDEELPELIAENLRYALQTLSNLTGHVHSEEILDVLFQDFCIGK